MQHFDPSVFWKFIECSERLFHGLLLSGWYIMVKILLDVIILGVTWSLGMKDQNGVDIEKVLQVGLYTYPSFLGFL